MRRRSTAFGRILTALALVTGVSACSTLPWSSTRKTEVNIAFRVEDNLPRVPFSYAGVEGEGILATARDRTVFDMSFAKALAREGQIRLGTEHVARVEPAVDELRGATEALIGSDALERRILTIDWRAGLATIFTRTPELRGQDTVTWTGAPAIEVEVDGRRMRAVIDTANPDSLVLPGASPTRYEATVRVAGAEHRIDVAVDPRVTEPRLGNRILVHYLIHIDYGRRTASLWRY